MTGKQNRRFHRVKFFADAELKSNSQSWATYILDISLNGVLIKIPHDCKLEIDQDCTLSIELDGSDATIEIAAYIRHLHEDKAGLCIHHIDLESISHLKRIIELNSGDTESLNRELSEIMLTHLE